MDTDRPIPKPRNTRPAARRERRRTRQLATGDRRVVYLPIDDIIGAERNPKRHDTTSINRSLAAFGLGELPLLDERTGRLVAGHGRINEIRAMRDGGQTAPAGIHVTDDGTWTVPVIGGWASRSDDDAAAYLVASNHLSTLGGWDDRELTDLLDELRDAGLAELTGFDDDAIDDLANTLTDEEASGEPASSRGSGALTTRFGVPPFTVFDARQGYWQERKKAWLGLGIASHEGRGADLLGGFASDSLTRLSGGDPENLPAYAGTSVFDPVLCEILIAWYSKPGQRVLDPFAGGSVRGLVSSRLERHYTGVDLRAEQIDANNRQAAEVAAGAACPPTWIVGDSRNLGDLVPGDEVFDMMLTCPPYADLEVYSDDPRDLSRADGYDGFLAGYRECLTAATNRMAGDAFAAIVTGAVRDKRGVVRDLPSDTTVIMEGLGWVLYQDAVLVTQAATAALRAGRQFGALRKLTRTHQMVGVYHRGDIDRVRAWPVTLLPEGDG